ncbi:MAG: hypothetical protein G01um101413_236 [Parcubacteria group bacterium Gr01-1014_13]|nr:MAG: hypothetical protein G01um101413_236 [Parcubacteria group bacterium Gr01-1014_13]
MFYLIVCLVWVLLAGGGGFILASKLAEIKYSLLLETTIIRRLAAKEALLLGTGGGPEGGQTVVQRLRQLGFTVLEKNVAPRAHMLGWLQTSRAESVCIYCKQNFLVLHEISEMKDHSVTGAFLVGAGNIGTFCNSCGIFQRITAEKNDEKPAGVGRLNSSFICPVLQKAHGCNLFDILDHLQTSGKMNEKFCEWLEERRQLLYREAKKISTTISQHQLNTAKDPSDDPYRELALPEANGSLKMLKGG